MEALSNPRFPIAGCTMRTYLLILGFVASFASTDLTQ
jgi:hypothetical protein